jgi:hypothetical protein
MDFIDTVDAALSAIHTADPSIDEFVYSGLIDSRTIALVEGDEPAIMRLVSEPTKPTSAAAPLVPPRKPSGPAVDDKVLCERCGAEMYRMHAVWRCPACGFKTDCCGW